MRDVNAVLSGCLSLAPRRLTVQKGSGTRRAPSTYWKHQRPRNPAESHCAAVRCSYPILRPRTRLSEERLKVSLRHGQNAGARMLDTPQSGSRFPAAIQLLRPSGVTAAIPEWQRPPQHGRTSIHKFGTMKKRVPGFSCQTVNASVLGQSGGNLGCCHSRIDIQTRSFLLKPTYHASLFVSNYQTPFNVLWLLLVSMSMASLEGELTVSNCEILFEMHVCWNETVFHLARAWYHRSDIRKDQKVCDCHCFRDVSEPLS